MIADVYIHDIRSRSSLGSSTEDASVSAHRVFLREHGFICERRLPGSVVPHVPMPELPPVTIASLAASVAIELITGGVIVTQLAQTLARTPQHDPLHTIGVTVTHFNSTQHLFIGLNSIVAYILILLLIEHRLRINANSPRLCRRRNTDLLAHYVAYEFPGYSREAPMNWRLQRLTTTAYYRRRYAHHRRRVEKQIALIDAAD